MILATGSGYRELGLPDEKRALRPRRLVVRDLRRLLLPRPGHRRRRRRRLRDRGGDLPDPVRPNGHARPPPRRAARLQDHAGARVRQRRRSSSPGTPRSPTIHGDDQGSAGVTLRDTVDRRGARRSTSPACSSRSATTRARELLARPGRPRRRGLRPRRRTAPPRTNLPGVFACRRPGRPPLPPGDHRRRHRLRRRPRRRALPRRARPRRRDRRRRPGRRPRPPADPTDIRRPDRPATRRRPRTTDLKGAPPWATSPSRHRRQFAADVLKPTSPSSSTSGPSGAARAARSPRSSRRSPASTATRSPSSS